MLDCRMNLSTHTIQIIHWRDTRRHKESNTMQWLTAFSFYDEVPMTVEHGATSSTTFATLISIYQISSTSWVPIRPSEEGCCSYDL
jgi:hypothetical protein